MLANMQSRSSFLITLVVILQSLSALAQAPIAKLPVPDSVSKKKASVEIKEIYGGEFSKASTTSKKIALAKRLLQEGVATKNNPVSRYVLFRISKVIATGAGDANTAFLAIEQMSKYYKVDSFQLKSDALQAAAKNSKTKNLSKIILDKASKLIEDSFNRDKYDLAKKLSEIALSAAKKVRDRKLMKQIVARNKEIEAVGLEFEKLKPFFAALKTNPTDPIANMKIGKFFCLAKGDWQKGLAMLALCNDAKLKALAAKELQGPRAADFLVLGEGWWQQAETEEGKVQKQLQAHAAIWYRKALPELTGIDKTKVAKRLSQIPEVSSLGSTLSNDSLAARLLKGPWRINYSGGSIYIGTTFQKGGAWKAVDLKMKSLGINNGNLGGIWRVEGNTVVANEKVRPRQNGYNGEVTVFSLTRDGRILAKLFTVSGKQINEGYVVKVVAIWQRIENFEPRVNAVLTLYSDGSVEARKGKKNQRIEEWKKIMATKPTSSGKWSLKGDVILFKWPGTSWQARLSKDRRTFYEGDEKQARGRLLMSGI